MPGFDRYSILNYFHGDPALRGIWSLRGDTLDLSGNANNGTVVNAIVQPGVPRNILGYYFDGAGDYITLTPAVNLEVFPITIIARVRVSSVPAAFAGIYAYLPKGAVNDGRGVYFGIFPDGRFASGWGGGTGAFTTLATTGYYGFGRDIVIAFTLTSADAKIYINGILDTQSSGAYAVTYVNGAGVNPPAKECNIGCWQTTGTQYWLGGTINEVAVFARELTPEEILKYYQGLSPRNIHYLEDIIPIIPLWDFNIKIKNSIINNNGDAGIVIKGSGLTIQSSTISGNETFGIEILGDGTEYAEDNKILMNNINGHVGTGMFTHGGIFIEDSYKTDISGNTIDNNTRGIILNDALKYNTANNIMRYNYEGIVDIGESEGGIISGNQIHGDIDDSANGIDIDGNDNKVLGNQITGYNVGVMIELGATDNEINSNFLKENNIAYTDNGTDTLIANNIV